MSVAVEQNGAKMCGVKVLISTFPHSWDTLRKFLGSFNIQEFYNSMRLNTLYNDLHSVTRAFLGKIELRM